MAAPGSNTRNSSLRKAIFWLHLGAGTVAGIVILTMSVTGLLLAYERQLVAWADREYRSSAPMPGATHLPVETLLAKIHEAPSSITLRSDPAAPVEAAFGRDRTVYFDAYSGATLGEGSQSIRAFFRKVEDWHRWLGAGGETRSVGRAITGACNLAFLILVVSGPYLWLPRRWTWQQLKPSMLFRGGLAGRARDWNWHNVTGFWCAVPLFFIVLSGVIMSYPWANNLLYRATGSEPPPQRTRVARETQRKHGDLAWSGFNALWASAEQRVPGWRSIVMRIPDSPRAPVAFTIDLGSGGQPDKRFQLALDRRSGETVQWEPFSSYNLGRRLRSWARFGHTGEAGGLAGQTVAAIASAGGALLVWTGLALALRRLRRWREKKRSTESALIHA
jgi:uncharacterized iron-regulated membrane protein